MPQFILKIDLGNDVIREDSDISYILRNIAAHIDVFGIAKEGNNIRDINDNVVGHYEVVPE